MVASFSIFTVCYESLGAVMKCGALVWTEQGGTGESV